MSVEGLCAELCAERWEMRFEVLQIRISSLATPPFRQAVDKCRDDAHEDEAEIGLLLQERDGVAHHLDANRRISNVRNVHGAPKALERPNG